MAIHRKLIRPKMKEVRENTGKLPDPPLQPALMPTTSGPTGTLATSRRKQIPSEQTNAESFYYLKQMQTKTPMVLILDDGEQIRGYIEWYDKHCLKVNRHKEPNLMVMKQCIRYMYKQEDEIKTHRRRKRANLEAMEQGEKQQSAKE